MRLKGFQGFLGGLDSEKDMTGQFSVQTEFAGLEIMFHVSTLMPFDPNDPQQVRCGKVLHLPLSHHVSSVQVMSLFLWWGVLL